MADAIVSAVADQLISTVKEQIQQEIKLVRGVEKELLDLSDKLNKVRNVLDDADTKQFKEKTVRDWLHRLEQASYEMEDVLDEWNYAILQHNKMESAAESAPPPMYKVCPFIPSSCFSFKKLVVRHDIANKVQNLKLRLHEILNEKDVHNFVISRPKSEYSPVSRRVQSTSLIDSSVVQGRKDDTEIMANKITANKGLGCQVISVVGAGGLGKTTLAQLVYNDSLVQQCFDLRIWICVSDPFDVSGIAKGIIKAITRQCSSDTTQLDVLLQDMIVCISGKRILLVLDDVWIEEYEKWEPLKNALKCGGTGSKVLVTTRKEKVAKIMGTIDQDIHRLELLSGEDCRLLLMHTALTGRNPNEFEKFQEIGKEIAKKCNGLPLAAKTLGSILGFKKTIPEWDNILKSEMWGLEQVEVELFPHLLLSYHELLPMLKRCFSFCAFFPKDHELEVEKIIRIWMALGYLGSNIGSVGPDIDFKGREVFEDLAMRSLFQNIERDDSTEQMRSGKMHDIVHDFAQFLRKNGRVEAPRITKRTCLVCDPSLASRAQEYRSLFWDKESTPNLCDCLSSLRVLGFEMKLVNGSPKGMEKLIHLRWLNVSGTRLSKEDLITICKLYFLQTLLLSSCSLREIPEEIGNLFYLKHLDLDLNHKLKELPKSICSLVGLHTLFLAYCSLEEIPANIGNLLHLRHFNLNRNTRLKELPQSLCSLLELQTLLLEGCSLEEVPSGIGNLIHLRQLNLNWNKELKELPESICSLVELQTLVIYGCENLRKLPKGLAHLSGIRSLDRFRGGSGCSKFGLLKNLNNLSGSLDLAILVNSSSDLKALVGDAREAGLSNKTHLHNVGFTFIDERDQEECSSLSSSSLWVNVIEAFEPNQNLQFLQMWDYKGSRLPDWISSPLNLVREIELYNCSELSSLPPMGKLPFLKVLKMIGMDELKVLGGEWLGTRGRGEDVTNSQSSPVVSYPKLKIMTFEYCPKWSEWEDITAEEEEEFAAVPIMPCLEKLNMRWCDGLKKLPHRLLNKASFLQLLDITMSEELIQCYRDVDGSPWRSISQNNPQLQLRF